MDFGMSVNGAVLTPPRLSESSWAAAWSSWMLHRSVEGGGKGSHSHTRCSSKLSAPQEGGSEIWSWCKRTASIQEGQRRPGLNQFVSLQVECYEFTRTDAEDMDVGFASFCRLYMMYVTRMSALSLHLSAHRIRHRQHEQGGEYIEKNWENGPFVTYTNV